LEPRVQIRWQRGEINAEPVVHEGQEREEDALGVGGETCHRLSLGLGVEVCAAASEIQQHPFERRGRAFLVKCRCRST